MRAGVGVPQLEVRDGRDVPLHRFQRAQGRRKLVERVGGRGRPPGDIAPHGHVNEPQAPQPDGIGGRRGGGRHRRDHGVQQRQRQRRPQAAEERPAWQGPLGDDHSALLIWNGVLVTIASMIDENR